MTTPFTAHSKCRLCDSGNIEEVLDLGYSPLANAYLTAEQLAEVRTGKREEIFTPLRLFLCLDCGSVQLAHSVDPKVLFTDYIYASSTSPVFVKHFEDLALHVQKLGLVAPNDLVVDIGSNDGIALGPFQSLGCRALGIEPSKELALIAENRGLDVIDGYWSKNMGIDVASLHGKAKVITACNVFAHLSDLRGFVEGVLELLDNDGVFIFENSYLADVVDKMLFDTIYMEHQFYHSLKPLISFFSEYNLNVFRAERIPTHGGSIRVFVGRPFCGTTESDRASIDAALNQEESQSLDLIATYRQFADRLQCYKHRLYGMLKPYTSQDQTPIAYGCPAKFTTFTQVLELEDTFGFVIDDSPLKVGRFTPGSHIPIRSRGEAYRFGFPSIVVVSAWNFFDALIAKETGNPPPLTGTWLRPLPNLEVIHV